MLTIRGLAVPFGIRALITTEDGESFSESIAPEAFDDCLLSKSPVELRAATHLDNILPLFACTQDESLRLFSCRAGLAFEAVLPVDRQPDAILAYALLNSLVTGGDQCSIFMEDHDYRESVDADGNKHRTVIRALISHITVGISDGAYADATACWPADHDLDRAPARIRAMASRWGAGRRKPQQAKSREHVFASRPANMLALSLTDAIALGCYQTSRMPVAVRRLLKAQAARK